MDRFSLSGALSRIGARARVAVPKLRVLPLLAAAAASAGCAAQRPEWADGAIVREERPPNAPPQDLRGLAERLVTLHNRERAAAGTPPLSWDESLAASAAAYAPQLAQLGRLQHSARETRPGQGENLWMGTRGAYSIEDVVHSWAAERRIFRPGVFPNVSTSGEWSDVAHYTQLIWRTTTRVGCAFHSSAQWDFLVCRYSPPGNVAGQRVP
ncbi:MAG TPA: CAP domain-containing protein [Allosphingosinicella sp.]|jgi:hypothetical protein|nr:CAP domain-containing protein [Allosphingosinicella sp.]